MDSNVARLKAYISKLILFPRKAGKPKKGEIADCTKEQEKKAVSGKKDLLKMPAKEAEKAVFEPITKAMKGAKAYEEGRKLRIEKRDYGRKKRAEELAAAKKK